MEIIEGEDPVTNVEVEVTRIMIEVTEGTVEEEGQKEVEDTNLPPELLLVKTILLHPEVKGEDLKKGGKEGLLGTIVKSKSGSSIQNTPSFRSKGIVSLAKSKFRIQSA